MREFLHIEQETARAQGRGHQPELQSLRGLAAMTVLVQHCSFYYDYPPRLKRASEVLLNAHAAVVLFFVLSGYVLCKTLIRTPLDSGAVAAFYLRRVLRIYPALWIATVLALGYVALFHGRPLPPEVTPWWWPPSQRQFPVSGREYLFSFASVRTTLPVPIWTLTVELAASLLMPLAAVLIVRAPRAFVAASVVAAAGVAWSPVALPGLIAYLPAFLLGASILIVAPAIDRNPGSDGVWLAAAALGAAVLLFGRNAFVADFRFHYTAPAPLIVEAAGGTLLIAAVSARPRLFSPLRWPAVVWLGDISYSLYLLHLPILALVAGIGGEILGLPLFTGNRLVATLTLLAAVLTIAIPSAALSYRFVELPFLRLGKRLGEGLATGMRARRMAGRA